MNGRCLEVYDTKQAVARPFRFPFQKVAQHQGGVLSLEAGFSRGLRDMEQLLLFTHGFPMQDSCPDGDVGLPNLVGSAGTLRF